MAGKKEQSTGVDGYSLNGHEGWAQVRTLEDANAIASEEKFNVQFIRYDVRPNAKGVEVTIVLQLGNLETARKAEWSALLAVKKRHASLYGESKMAIQNSEGWEVHVRWMIWSNKINPETNLPF